MHSVEIPTQRTNATLSATSTEHLLSKDYSQPTLEAIQKELQAYLFLNPTRFAGILYHADGSGPENPYYFPTSKDWHPIIQAISRIGVQAEYWKMLHMHLTSGTANIYKLNATNIMVLHPMGDGRTQVETITPSQFDLDQLLKQEHIPYARFSKYVFLTNYAGDSDFYGTDNNAIFPMRVQISPNKFIRVPREQLGVSVELVQSVWEHWNIFNQYITAIIMNRSIHPSLIPASEHHMMSLQTLYNTAKQYRADMYHY